MIDNTIPQWQVLLKLAQKHLEIIGLSLTDWIWGGGTVLMLRYHHRLSRDIDLFLSDPQYLTQLSPRLNERISATVHHYTEQANHLRCFLIGVGEIDYLVAAPVIDAEPETMRVEGHGSLQVMSDREILAQKIHYRSLTFQGRDLFDFAAITSFRPELLLDEKLREIGQINKLPLNNRLNSMDLRESYESVIRHTNFKTPLSFEEARDAMHVWLVE